MMLKTCKHCAAQFWVSGHYGNDARANYCPLPACQTARRTLKQRMRRAMARWRKQSELKPPDRR